MKITKTQLKKLIKEALDEASASPVGSAELKATEDPVYIGTDGRFNMEVIINGSPEAITGQLDEDIVEYLYELGALKQF